MIQQKEIGQGICSPLVGYLLIAWDLATDSWKSIDGALTASSRWLDSWSPNPAFNRDRSKFEVAMRLRSLTHTHHSL